MSTVKTRGSHENYQLHKKILLARTGSSEESVNFDYVAQHLMPFLVARQIISGSGGVDLENLYGDNNYVLSPRALMIKSDISHDTTTDNAGESPNRGIVNSRKKPYADARSMRLHLICGDSNMSDYTAYLKVGVTSLILDLIEHISLPDLSIQKPVESMHLVSRDLTGKEYKIPLNNGKAYCALDMLKIYQDILHESLGRHFRDEQLAVLKDFDEAVKLLDENDPLDLVHMFDYATKHHLLQRALRSRGNLPAEQVTKRVLMNYHEVGGLFDKVRDKLGHRRAVSSEMIAGFRGRDAVTPETRAKGRVRFIRWGQKLGEVVVAGWDSVTVREKKPKQSPLIIGVKSSDNGTQHMPFSDPMDTYDDMELP